MSPEEEPDENPPLKDSGWQERSEKQAREEDERLARDYANCPENPADW